MLFTNINLKIKIHVLYLHPCGYAKMLSNINLLFKWLMGFDRINQTTFIIRLLL